MNGTVSMTMGRWLPPFGISFTVDLLGAFFAATSSMVAFAAGIMAAAMSMIQAAATASIRS